MQPQAEAVDRPGRPTRLRYLVCAAALAAWACTNQAASPVAAIDAPDTTGADVPSDVASEPYDAAPACPDGQELCGGACLPQCTSPTVRLPSCLCRDPRTPPKAVRGPVGDRLCLSVNPIAGNSAHAKARRQFVFNAAKQLGVRTLRVHFLWADVEPKQGQFQWGDVDAMRAESAAAGLDLLVVLAYGAPWASKAAQAHGNDHHYPPDDPAHFANYAAKLAAHLTPTVRDYEVWNEQNAGYRFWKGEPDGFNGNPANYAKLLVAAAQAVHAVDPKLRVGYGGLFYFPQLILGAEAFLDQSLTAEPGMGSQFDALGWHPYGVYPPLQPPEYATPDAKVPQWAVHQCADRMDAVLAKHQLPAKPHWVTELGWPSVVGGDPEQQARWLVRAYALLLARNVEYLCWYTIWDGDPATALAPWEAGFGLYTHDADLLDGSVPQAKPSALAHTRLSQQLAGLGWAADATQGPVRAQAFADPAGSSAVYVVWNDTLAVGATQDADPATVVHWPARHNRVYTWTPAVGLPATVTPDAAGMLALPVRASAGFLREAAAPPGP